MTIVPGETTTRLAEITAIRREAIDILSFSLAPTGVSKLPPFAAGAHIDLHIAPNHVRQYSLANNTAERNQHLIAVKLEHGGRGVILLQSESRVEKIVTSRLTICSQAVAPHDLATYVVIRSCLPHAPRSGPP